MAGEEGGTQTGGQCVQLVHRQGSVVGLGAWSHPGLGSEVCIPHRVFLCLGFLVFKMWEPTVPVSQGCGKN